MSKFPKIRLKQVLIATGITFLTLLAVPALAYGWLLLSRPPRTNTQQQMFQGITYRREARSTPRSLTIHIVTIDLAAAGIKVLVTPGNNKGWDKTFNTWNEIQARTTSEFVREYKLQLAINGSYFDPCKPKSPVDYYPRSGNPVNVIGQAISNGNIYSPADPGWAVLCFSADNRAQIREKNCDKSSVQGLAGSEIFLRRGKPVAIKGETLGQQELYPRTAVATDKSGEKLWLIVIDGRQPHYSEGVTLAELSDIVMELGADTALNLDGGGSTTLVSGGSKGAHSLNAPIQTYVPMRQRAIANHLGFYAKPVN